MMNDEHLNLDTGPFVYKMVDLLLLCNLHIQLTPLQSHRVKRKGYITVYLSTSSISLSEVLTN